MAQHRTSLVEILREFIDAYMLLEQLSERFHAGALTFDELQVLIGDDEGSVLFRLKEKCHHAFRPDPGGEQIAPREALFDLAIGSLFHEAMKFREDFYQREVYAPRVRALREETDEHADGLFHEFERIMTLVVRRLEEELQETQALMQQSWVQLRVLLAEHPEDGLATRLLIERRDTLDAAFEPGLDGLLEQIHGDTASGYAIAGRSYLASGHYAGATRLFGDAIEGGLDDPDAPELRAFASGMAAYLEGDYPSCVARLEAWIERGCVGGDRLGNAAQAALASLGQLVRGDGADVLDGAQRLLARLQGGEASAARAGR